MTFNLQAPPITPRSGMEAKIAALAPWFHNVTLPGGEQTAPNHPLGDFPRFKWEQIRDHIPSDLTGRTALDIGCNAGFYALEMARRGAHVVGIDHDEHYLMQARWVAEQFGLQSRLDYRRLSLLELARSAPGSLASFDVVLFMGVFYHLRYPLLGLDIAAAMTGSVMVFQTLTTPDATITPAPQDLPLEERGRLSAPGWPRMSFVERSLASDPTNWWIPNAACCEAMLRSTGLTITARPGHEIYICRRAEAPPPRTRELETVLGP
jgi:tRNA (mo5U34)-methyltransferase